MKRLALIAAMLAVAAVGLVDAAESAERWQRILQVESEKLPVILRLEERRPGRFNCFINVIGRSDDAMACTDVTVSSSRVAFSIDPSQLKFDGTLKDPHTLDGTWSSPSGTRPLQLSKVSAAEAWPTDPVPHKEVLVTTKGGVRLEVLNYGGAGSPVLLLSGLAATAHIFDKFAPRLARKHHVYALTRRAYGLSDTPAPYPSNYGTARLADDVIEVIDS